MENFTHNKSLGPMLVTDTNDMLLIGSVSYTQFMMKLYMYLLKCIPLQICSTPMKTSFNTKNLLFHVFINSDAYTSSLQHSPLLLFLFQVLPKLPWGIPVKGSV